MSGKGKVINLEEIIQEKLMQNYAKYYRLAYSYVRNEADAQDIVQEGAYKAILNSNTLKNKEYADTWIYRIMINEALTYIRKNKIKYMDIEEIQESTTDNYADVDLKKAMDTLEPLDKTIIILRFFEDLKLNQIAEITKENLNTVKTRLYRALKKLNVSLSEEGYHNG